MSANSDDDVPIESLTGAMTIEVVTASSQSRDPSGFIPGLIVGGRYRLVSLLGRGGMGEVYRADDLMLDQPVALKFLPVGVASDAARLAQFHNELRIARQISHKNVCRLYDVGQAEGRRFLTMEYVDGEDLGTSLRRFGRMPPDKAVQIARQLCAGVTAAHEKGVLHRDLKPANVMLDGNGDVRITDFGIATAVADPSRDIAGTPQYMAPELLTGKAASIKSDIYALGLILFEVFTGRRAFEARTIGELKQLHETQTITTPSAIVRDLDPAIEQVILRCLQKDPDRRPASALTVAAALPGGDPLAAALAAGETPSPELLVAAGESQAMPVAPALAIVVTFLVVLLASVAAVSHGSVAGLVPMPIPPDALADRARQILEKLGYTNDIADRAMGFQFAQDYLQWEQQHGSADWWKRLQPGRPPALIFWYRTSPRELPPPSPADRVSSGDPPMNVAGMHQLFLDAEGHLVEFHSVPPQVVTQDNAPAPPWETAFEAADLDAKTFTSTPSTWIPREFADATAAWDGPLPGRSDLRVHVEAASFRNRLVSFQIIWPWTVAARIEVPQRTGLQRTADTLSVAVWISLLAGAVLFARHNVRAGRADRRGAARLATGMMLASFVSRLLSETHSASPVLEMTSQIFGALAFSALAGGVIWVTYLAIEPYARRFWPDALLGWTRLLSGHLRDSRVGRELLIGLLFGAGALLLDQLHLVPMAFGYRLPKMPFGEALLPLVGVPLLFARWLNELNNALQTALAVAMIFVVMRLLLKRSGLALGAGLVALMLSVNMGSAVSGSWMDTIHVGAVVLLWTVAIRFGLLAIATGVFASNLVTNIPITTDLSAWWATPTLLTLALLIGLACLAYSTARAGQPLFGQMLPD